jgi:hypothetical protein
MSKQLVSDSVQAVNQRLGRHQPIVLVAVSIASTYLLFKFHRFWNKSERSLWSRFKSYTFGLIRRLPPIQRRIKEEMGPKVQSIVNSIHECDKERDFIR